MQLVLMLIFSLPADQVSIPGGLSAACRGTAAETGVASGNTSNGAPEAGGDLAGIFEDSELVIEGTVVLGPGRLLDPCTEQAAVEPADGAAAEAAVVVEVSSHYKGDVAFAPIDSPVSGQSFARQIPVRKWLPFCLSATNTLPSLPSRSFLNDHLTGFRHPVPKKYCTLSRCHAWRAGGSLLRMAVLASGACLDDLSLGSSWIFFLAPNR